MITAEELREILDYDPEAGVFTWKKKIGDKVVVGRVAGGTFRASPTRQYYGIRLYGKYYPAHRLAVLYMTGEWPAFDVDHANGATLDNRWSNLRLATRVQNNGNAKMRRDNSSGFKGVSFDRRRGKYRASIHIDGKQKYLGRFGTAEAAHAAYVAAAEKHFGEYARAA